MSLTMEHIRELTRRHRETHESLASLSEEFGHPDATVDEESAQRWQAATEDARAAVDDLGQVDWSQLDRQRIAEV